LYKLLLDEVISSMRQTLTAVQNANHAQGRAIDRVMATNKLAMKLFNDPDSPQ